jgi:hypothetical protein
VVGWDYGKKLTKRTQLSSFEKPRKQQYHLLHPITGENISHKNQEISILIIKKMHSKVNTSSTSHREFKERKTKQRTKDQEINK